MSDAGIRIIEALELVRDHRRETGSGDYYATVKSLANITGYSRGYVRAWLMGLYVNGYVEPESLTARRRRWRVVPVKEFRGTRSLDEIRAAR
jgi:DNA-binding transcriptional ArsR family regulator